MLKHAFKSLVWYIAQDPAFYGAFSAFLVVAPAAASVMGMR